VVPLHIPPLRERKEDLFNFAKYFINIYNKKFNKDFEHIDDGAKEKMLNYEWPGNIRELKNSIERIVLLEEGPVLKASFLPFASGGAEDSTIGKMLDRIMSQPLPDDGVSLEEIVAVLEKELIIKASEQAGWNQSKTARLLSLKRDKLRYRMKGYELGEGKEVTSK
jgi:DNA-binding NtrC family response regulator